MAQLKKVITAQLNFPYIAQGQLITRRTRTDYLKMSCCNTYEHGGKNFPKNEDPLQNSMRLRMKQIKFHTQDQ